MLQVGEAGFPVFPKVINSVFREQLALLDMALKTAHEPSGRTSFRRTETGADTFMATMNPPKLLLLDEHTAALDPGTAEKVLNLLAGSWKNII